MKLILKSNNKESIAKIVDLARELNVFVVRKESDKVTDVSLKDRILNFKAIGPSSYLGAHQEKFNHLKNCYDHQRTTN